METKNTRTKEEQMMKATTTRRSHSRLTRVFYITLTALIFPFSGLLGVADAAEINTPTIQTRTNPSVDYVCRAANVSNKNITVDIDLINLLGTMVVATTSLDIPAGQSRGMFAHGGESFTARCRVTGKFSKKKVIVNLMLVDATTDITLVSVTGQ